MKRVMCLMSIMNNEPINVGRMMAKNIKYMDDTSQRACGHLCIINALCGLTGVQCHPTEEMIAPMQSINYSSMKRIPTILVQGGAQEEAQDEE